MAAHNYTDEEKAAICATLIDRFCQGQSLRTICADPEMPNRWTIWDWTNKDDELGKQIRKAREIGYYARAEDAVHDAKNAADAAKGRLAFDAERWELSKLSKGFADKVVHAGDAEQPLRVEMPTEEIARLVTFMLTKATQ
jgi:hypothetical protein